MNDNTKVAPTMEDIQFLATLLDAEKKYSKQLFDKVIALAEENERLRAYNDRVLVINEKLVELLADQDEMLREYITNTLKP
jgi:hypothetical protein